MGPLSFGSAPQAPAGSRCRMALLMNKRPTVAVLSLTGITVCKVIVLLLLIETGHLQPYVGDNAQHIYLPAANHLLTTGSYDDRNTLSYSGQAPGYSVFLAFVQRVSSSWYLRMVVCLQVLLDGCTALCLLFLGMRLNSFPAGWLAGACWLLFPPALVISTWITAETLFTTLFVLSMVIWIAGLVSGAGLRWSFIAGCILGAATLVRGTTQLLPVFLFLLFFAQPVSKYPAKCGLLFLGTCLAVVPWAVRNLRVLGEPIIVQTGFGAVFQQGSRSAYFTIPGKTRLYPVLIREAAQDGLPRPSDGKATSLDHWHLHLALLNYRERWLRRPFSFAPFLIHKFARLWYGAETGTFYKQLILGICSLAVIPMGIFQIWVWRRTDRRVLSLTLSLVTAYFVILHVIAYPEFRYVFPLFPLFLFAASHQYINILGHRSSPAQVFTQRESAA